MLILHFCSFHSYFLSLAFLALSPSGSGGRLGLDVEALDGVEVRSGWCGSEWKWFGEPWMMNDEWWEMGDECELYIVANGETSASAIKNVSHFIRTPHYCPPPTLHITLVNKATFYYYCSYLSLSVFHSPNKPGFFYPTRKHNPRNKLKRRK